MESVPRAAVGDLILIEGHHVGEARRRGEILEILGTAGHTHYRVRWEDDHETLFYPSNDAVIQHAQQPKPVPR